MHKYGSVVRAIGPYVVIVIHVRLLIGQILIEPFSNFSKFRTICDLDQVIANGHMRGGTYNAVNHPAEHGD